MASIGHIAVGMAAARADRRGRRPAYSAMALWALLSMLPDADVIGFALGVQYGDPWGHRGATHSFAFSIAIGLVIGLMSGWFRRPVFTTGVMATAVLASHALLDTMTDGGLGCALLWPFDLTRYFAPWRPIPVAPIGLAFVSWPGAAVALTELVLFSPVLVFAFRRRKLQPIIATIVLTLWSVAVWLVASTDSIRDNVVGVLLREDTAYASGFSEAAFRTIRPGASDREVRGLVGAPLGESWIYPSEDQPFEPAMARSSSSLSGGCLAVRFEAGVVVAALARDACVKRGIVEGLPLPDAQRVLGPPPESCWGYTRSLRGGHHRLRVVCFRNGTVNTLIRRWE